MASLTSKIMSPRDWNEYAKRHNVKSSNIYQLQRYDSASKIEDPQYLTLRALWKIERRTQFEPHQWDIHGAAKARQMLEDLPHWKNYIQAVSKKVPVDEILPIPYDLGDFKLVWYYQQLIWWAKSTPDLEDNLNFTPISKRTRGQSNMLDRRNIFMETPSKVSSLTKKFREAHLEETVYDNQMETASTDEELEPDTPADNLEKDPDFRNRQVDKEEFPPVSDENVVNTGLIGFASVVTFSIKGVKAHWSQKRKGYKVGENNGTKLYEARTDGHLSLPNDSNSKAIVEVKPTMRGESPRVRMQETAQMAAWIHVERGTIGGKKPEEERFRRLLLSQDRHEIYIILADYDADYVDYLTNPNRDSACQSFLTMNEFGPWDISDAGAVEEIASIILAVTLQLGNGEPLI
ncbi:hypothetical protein ACJ73_09640 [Blastomyces percursus]|uniref:Uncharacterized protein n=1 Tax=Blastomyces percursus TaxID=1658174 RepID=A0A1J9P4C4_9EURO|nr:hypothetical protein ACJ73_09640 [Blastomyces percursus]